MKNPFHRFRSWHGENIQYDGFFEFEVFASITLIIFITNIFCRIISAVDWLIFVVWLQSALLHCYKWLRNRSQKEILDFVKDRCKEMIDELIGEKYTERYRLVAANRRRKRAECKLKKKRLELRGESAMRLGFEVKVDEYEEMLLTAYAATFDYSGRQLTDEDIVRIKEAGRTFNEYMQSHYPEIARRKFWRDYKQDTFDCIFLGDSAGDPNRKS